MLKLLYGRCYASLFFLNESQAQNWTGSMKMAVVCGDYRQFAI
jgi:hypothetical protein